MKNFLVILVALSATSVSWAASGKTSTYNNPGQVVTDAIVLDNETEEKTDSTNNRLNFGTNAGTFNGTITAGQSETANAANNSIYIQGGTFNSGSITAGNALKGDATDNTLSVKNVTLSSDLVAGFATAGKATGNVVNLDTVTVTPNAGANNIITAGSTTTGEATNNTVNIQNSTVSANVYGGYSAGTADATYNSVNISKTGTSAGKAIGGYSKEGIASRNSVVISDSVDASSAIAIGGSATAGIAEYNTVTIKNAAKIGSAYGAMSTSGANVSYNSVLVSDSAEVTTALYGASSDGTANVLRNKVVVTSSGLGASVETYGGFADKGNASYNTVSITGTSIGKKVYGGASTSGETASFNKVAIAGTNSSTTAETVIGGYAGKGNAANNSVSLSSDLTLTDGLYGAQADNEGGALYNEVNLTGSNFTGNLYGAKTAAGAATLNAVSVAGGSVTGNIYGGYSTTGGASGNLVSLNNTTVTGDVYGGFSNNNSETSNNTIVLSGNTVITGNFYGGNGTTSTNNTLLLNNYTGTINALNSIQTTTIQGLASNVTFTTNVDAGFKLAGKPGEIANTIAHTTAGSTITLNSDALGVYLYSIDSIANGGGLDWSVKGTFSNDLAKPYAQVPLAGLALASLGDNMLERSMEDAINKTDDKNVFFSAQYFDRKYKTGSGFDMSSAVFQAGNFMRLNSGVLGLFAQYAYGDYNTFPMSAKGGVNSFALGGFGILPLSDIVRLEGVTRLGYQQTDFKADMLSSNFDMNTFFYGLSGALVGQYEQLSVYGKLAWLRKAGKNVSDSIGQNIDADAVQSVTGKAGMRYQFQPLSNRYKPFAAIAGIYEMDGDSTVSIDGHGVTGDTSLKGFTVETELGLEYDNEESVLPVKSMFSIFGLLGQNAGWGGSVKLAFEF